jgi:hypothetical protein
VACPQRPVEKSKEAQMRPKLKLPVLGFM